MVDGTADWAAARADLAGELTAATDGLTILAARTEEQEARAIAIAARQALARKQTVGILSPDQTLSRRIAAELMRFEIAVDDAAGVPLYQSAAGRFARALLALAVGKVAPVDLMAVLQNRAASFGLVRRQVSRAARLIDLGLLRGQYLRPGFAGLRQALAENVDRTTKYPARRLFADDSELIGPVLDAVEKAIAPLVTAVGAPQIAAPELAAAIASVVNAATKPGPGDDPAPLSGRTEVSNWAATFAEAEEAGPPFRPVALDAVLATLMAGQKVTTAQPGRDDIAIWGLLEARLQSADLTILAGLNEDVWPAAADPGPWLSRGMRIKAGLEPPERQQGQAAHDFEMALGGRQVLLCFAERRGTSPALPSRLVQRLEAFLGDDLTKVLRERARPLITAAQAVDFAGMPAPARRPFPKPPVDVRPKALSVTEIERLYRSPYDLYARHVLRLSPLAPLGQEPGGRERGSLIHDVFARFVMEERPLDGAARAVLEEMAAEAFGGLDAIGERRDIWLKRFSVAAALFLDFERARDAGVLKRNAEVAGRLAYPRGFTLTGRADRIDVLSDGSLEILDFKTGTVPPPKEMRAFEAPQLLLEAVMAAIGAFEGIQAAPASALTYIKIGSGAKAYRPQSFTPPGDDLVGAIVEANLRLQRHVDALLLSGKLPMGARIVPDAKQRFRGDYDHLARTEEWLVQEDPDF